MIECIKSMAAVIFHMLTYKFDAGDIKFSLWDVVMTFLICALVGMLIYLFIRGISKDE